MGKAARSSPPHALSPIAKSKVEALVQLNSSGLAGCRDFLLLKKLLEVQASSLEDLSGCSEKALSLGQIPYLPEQGNLILQLDTLAVAFQRGYFTINETMPPAGSNNHEHHSRFMTVESVWPVKNISSEAALGQAIACIEDCVKFTVRDLLEEHHPELFRLGSDLAYLTRMLRRPFVKITFEEAIKLLDRNTNNHESTSTPITSSEMRQLLSYFCWLPVFVIYGNSKFYHPSVKFTHRGMAFAAELLLPRVGVAARGTVLEGSFAVARSKKNSCQTLVQDTNNTHSDSVSPEAYFEHLGTNLPGERAAISLSFEQIMAFIFGVPLL